MSLENYLFWSLLHHHLILAWKPSLRADGKSRKDLATWLHPDSHPLLSAFACFNFDLSWLMEGISLQPERARVSFAWERKEFNENASMLRVPNCASANVFLVVTNDFSFWKPIVFLLLFQQRLKNERVCVCSKKYGKMTDTQKVCVFSPAWICS